ncbi:MAG: ABC transporter substrate-binding protein [Pseudomonadota bacterium]
MKGIMRRNQFLRFFPRAALFVLLFLGITVSANAATIVDSAGRKVEAAHPFSRIISLYAAHTENIAALGLESELIGITESDDYPPRVLGKKRFSYKEDPEKFIAARPDLVLVRPMIERSYPQLIDKLRQAGIVVVSLQPNTVGEIADYWRTLGALTGRTAEAEKMVADFQQGMAEIGARVGSIRPGERVRVYFEAIHKKMKTFAPQSIAIYVLQQAGGVNVAADAFQVRETNIADYGKERILAKAEEIDVFLAQQGRMNPVTRETIMNEPGFPAINAVRQGKVFLVDERLVSRPTMRILDGVRQINAILYPGLLPSREESHER